MHQEGRREGGFPKLKKPEAPDAAARLRAEQVLEVAQLAQRAVHDEAVGQAAGLRALPAVRAAPAPGLAGEALPAAASACMRGRQSLRGQMTAIFGTCLSITCHAADALRGAARPSRRSTALLRSAFAYLTSHLALFPRQHDILSGAGMHGKRNCIRV